MAFSGLLSEELSRVDLTLSERAQKKLVEYALELERWNRAINLTALHGRELVRRLLVEPCWIGHQLHMSGKAADIGSGNGSPGIPLALTVPLEIDLIESRVRRCAFLRHVVQKIDLKGVMVHNSRLEELGSSPGLKDWIILQAVHPTMKLLRAMTSISSVTTQVVWITSVEKPPVATARLVSVPNSNTRGWIFRLDQS